MKQVWINPDGLVAIRVSLAALIVGGVWVVYLFWTAGPFPPDILRLVPVVWLVSSFAGLILGLQAALADVRRYLGIISVLLCLPSIPLAAVFTLAAMVGD